MMADLCGTVGEVYSILEEVWFDVKSLVWWEECGRWEKCIKMGEVWYVGRRVVY